ncbi:MAG: hypothetical protein GWN14_10210 [candidate division Zixibacteria bacterium]|nr:hypothetical protein [Gammaproteobacteria bacterium]NIX56276.1 hypothetical protein [candidate division Zixibacteria bacterium]
MEPKNKNILETNEELWPPELDALVASPKQHKLLFENERVRVLETHIAPGETTPAHTHCWPSVYYILSWSDFLRRDGEGNLMVDSRENEKFRNPPPSMWSDALPLHSLENVGDQPITLISFELKD